MRSVVSILVAFAMLAASAIAHAEIKTTGPVTLRARPGEKSAAVAQLPAGTEVTVIREQGRWVFVRAGKVEGYLTRTTVTLPDAPPPERGAAWAATHDSDAVTTTASAAPTASVRATEPEPVHRAPPRALAVRAEAGVGFRSLGMDLTSNTAGALSNYLVDAGAVVGTGRVVVIARLAAPWFVGADATVRGGYASPGIDYPGPSAAPGKIAFRTFAADAGARAGLRVHDSVDLALRVGGRYDAFLPDSVDNAGMLPRERLLGVTAGLRIDAAPPRSPISATLWIDVLALGSRAQTAGLEDGTASTSRGVWGGVTLRVPIGARWAVLGDLELGRETTQWSGASTRAPGATSTRRVDTTQLLQLGVGAEL